MLRLRRADPRTTRQALPPEGWRIVGLGMAAGHLVQARELLDGRDLRRSHGTRRDVLVLEHLETAAAWLFSAGATR